MRFEPSRGFNPGPRHRNAAIAPDIAFLLADPTIDPAALRDATRHARAQGVSASRWMIAEGRIGARAFYRRLAAHLGVAFVEDWPALAPGLDVARAHRTGRVRLLEHGDTVTWLLAPRGDIARLVSLRESETDFGGLALATPAHFAALVNRRAQPAVEHTATTRLPETTPRFCAHGAVTRPRIAATCVLVAAGITATCAVPHLMHPLIGLMFFGSTCFRLIVGAAGFPPDRGATAPRPDDAVLPDYTVLVPLHNEADVVPELFAAIGAIDYPRAKLQVLVLIEPEDRTTRDALARLDLPPWVDIVFAPVGGALRTKPRALNVGLAMARGTCLTVFDAEDRPDPDQLRRAAAVFAGAPSTLACLQARLCIDNSREGALAGLFALEYAGLFDVFNVGLACLGLPIALGGTSNHFRRAALDAVGGWDAWNVTEDADLGLRLARFGYAVGCLDSTTSETAPLRTRDWLQQRRRWAKGWLQTAIVLMADAPRVARDLGPAKTLAVALLLVNLVVGPLLLPVFSGFVAWTLACSGLPCPRSQAQIVTATVSTCVLMLGLASAMGYGCAGLRARRLWHLALHVPLLLPYYLMISAAAWLALVDLLVSPYHWHKTPHKPRAAIRSSGPTAPSRPAPAPSPWPFHKALDRTDRRCRPAPD